MFLLHLWFIFIQFSHFPPFISWFTGCTNRIYIWVCTWGRGQSNMSWCVCVYVWGCPLCESIYWFDVQGHSVSSASNSSHKTVKRFQIYYRQMKQTHCSSWWGGLPHLNKVNSIKTFNIIRLFLQKEICLDLSCKNDCQGGVRTYNGFWIDFFDL